jgi:hypothetical protein
MWMLFTGIWTLTFPLANDEEIRKLRPGLGRRRRRESRISSEELVGDHDDVNLYHADHHTEELEAQVAQLAADKASLENENRLLKAIVLGGNGNGSLPSTESIAQLAGKRKRE